MSETRSASSLARVAAFVAEVGEREDKRFTKEDLLAAVPGVAQADRRMRELREMGWVIENYKTDPNLTPSQYLVRTIGTRVDLGLRRPAVSRRAIPSTLRRNVLERDGHYCQICGIIAGAEYSGEPGKKAVLTVEHVGPIAQGGLDELDNLQAVCTRCTDATTGAVSDPSYLEQVFTHIDNIGDLQGKERVFHWMALGRRIPDEGEQAFKAWSRLPTAQRLEALAKVAQQIAQEKQ